MGATNVKVARYNHSRTGNWVVDYRDSTGSRRRKFFHTRAGALAKADQLKVKEEARRYLQERVKYATQIGEHSSKLKAFVFDRLQSEISELHSDQKVMAENFQKLEEFVVDALSKEIAEFNEDKQDVAETKVRLIREAKAHFEKVRTKFITKSAEAVTTIVEKTLKNEISQLREDIDAARKNDFGRRLYESYAQEYSQSFLNEIGRAHV